MRQLRVARRGAVKVSARAASSASMVSDLPRLTSTTSMPAAVRVSGRARTPAAGTSTPTAASRPKLDNHSDNMR